MVFNIEVKEHTFATPSEWSIATNYPSEGFYKIYDGVKTCVVIVFKGVVTYMMDWVDFDIFGESGMEDVYPGEGYVPPIKYKLENSVSEEFVLELMDKVINGLNDGKGKQPVTRKQG